MQSLLKRDGKVYMEDVRRLLSEVEKRPDEATIRQAAELLLEKARLLDQRQNLVAELADVEAKTKSLTDLLASGKLGDESYKTAREDLEVRKRDLQEKMYEVDARLYKEDYDKPI